MAFKNYDKPSSVPGWAPANPADVVEPSAAKKALGFQESEYPPYEYFNWMWNSLSEWASFYDDQFNTKSIATTQNDTAAVTSKTELDAYISSLPYVINHNIIINCSGAGYSGGSLVINDHVGNGSITLNNSGMTEDLQDVKIENVALSGEIKVDGFTFDGGFYAFSSGNSKRVVADNCIFTNCNTCLRSYNDGSLKAENITIGVGNGTLALAVAGGEIHAETSSFTASNAFSDKIYQSQSSGKVSFDSFDMWSTSTGEHAEIVTGGVIMNPFGLGNAESNDITISVPNQTEFDKVHSILKQAAFIPSKSTLRINIASGTFSNTRPWDINYFGGGNLVIDGNGIATTILQGFDTTIKANGFVTIKELKFNNDDDTMIIENSTVLFDSFDMTNSSILQTAMTIDYSNVRFVDSIVSSGLAILGRYNSLIMLNNCTLSANTYYLQLEENTTAANLGSTFPAGSSNIDLSSVLRNP